MKRLISLALCLVLVFSLCACTKKPAETKTDDPIIGRWLHRSYAFIQVLTFTEDNIERQYMTFEPENMSYKVNLVSYDGDTTIYSLAITEGEFTYDAEMKLKGDTLEWEDLEYRRLAEDEEVDFLFTEEEVQDMLFSENDIVQIDPETGKPVDEEVTDTPKKEPDTKEETSKVDTPSVSSDPLVGLWRHQEGDFLLEYDFTDGKKYEYYKGDRSFYTTYKVISVTDNGDGTTSVQIEETDEGITYPVNIKLEGDTLKYGEDEFVFTKVK